MAENRLFVESEALERWVRAGHVELAGDLVRVRTSGTRYVVDEAVHVLAEVTGAGDPHGLVGGVRAVKALSALGAEVVGRAVVMGESAYDGMPGFLMTPLGPGGARVPTAAAVRVLSRPDGAEPPLQSDEELLARYLIDKL